jgi:hypothetical protein
LEPAIRGTPVVESQHAHVFALASSNHTSAITLKTMKTILHITDKQGGSRRGERRSHRTFPLTDYNYHPTAEAETMLATRQPTNRPPAFHRLSSGFFGGETSRDYVAELSFFILITCLAGWAVISTVISVVRMIRNY